MQIVGPPLYLIPLLFLANAANRTSDHTAANGQPDLEIVDVKKEGAQRELCTVQ